VRAQRRGDLSNPQIGALNNAGETVARWEVEVKTGLGTVAEICAAARVAHEQGGLDMLVVDYLQLVANGHENRVLDLEQTTRSLKLLGNQLGIVVVLLSQPNNADAKSGQVGLFSGKGSGSIAADCDALIVPVRDSADPSRAGLSLPGCRHADAHSWPVGSLVFDGARMTFREGHA
jgi:replicative DNA helicase